MKEKNKVGSLQNVRQIYRKIKSRMKSHFISKSFEAFSLECSKKLDRIKFHFRSTFYVFFEKRQRELSTKLIPSVQQLNVFTAKRDSKGIFSFFLFLLATTSCWILIMLSHWTDGLGLWWLMKLRFIRICVHSSSFHLILRKYRVYHH